MRVDDDYGAVADQSGGGRSPFGDKPANNGAYSGFRTSGDEEVEFDKSGLPRCGQLGKRICDEEPRCDEGLIPEETGLCAATHACGMTL